ncbi:MAG: hypothetical protein QXF05_04720 [Thermofilaceae archaeon]
MRQVVLDSKFDRFQEGLLREREDLHAPQPRSCLAKPVGSIDKGDEHVELHYRHAPLSQSAHLRLLNGPVCDSGVAVAVTFESSQLFVLIVQRAAS